MKYYRVRTRKDKDHMVVIADNLPTLEDAYNVVYTHGHHTSLKFYIDEVEPKLFSKLTSRTALKRLEELKHENNN